MTLVVFSFSFWLLLPTWSITGIACTCCACHFSGTFFLFDTHTHTRGVQTNVTLAFHAHKLPTMEGWRTAWLHRWYKFTRQSDTISWKAREIICIFMPLQSYACHCFYSSGIPLWGYLTALFAILTVFFLLLLLLNVGMTPTLDIWLFSVTVSLVAKHSFPNVCFV